MQRNLAGQHLDATPALKKYVNTKLKKLERHFDHVTNAHVVLSIEKLRQRAEATVHISADALHADPVDDDMHAAIHSLIDKLDWQIVRHKEKLASHNEEEGGLKAR